MKNLTKVSSSKPTSTKPINIPKSKKKIVLKKLAIIKNYKHKKNK